MVRMSVVDAGLQFGALVDRVSSEGLVVELQRDERVIARLTPVEEVFQLPGIDYAWLAEDADVWFAVDEFSEATHADY
jgi:antitoxin (DNA-binding transcriptional repressor) of toxin-antitoxin stability system